MGLLAYLFPYVIPLLLIPAITEGGLWTWIPFSVVFVFHPILDQLIGPALHDKLESPRLATLLLVSYVSLQLALMLLAMNHALTTPGLSSFEVWGLALSTGSMTGGIGITVAHELVHRRSRPERGLGVLLLLMVTYTQFRVEHVHGHHLRAATREDPATARRGESVYAFWVRSIVMGLLSAWHLEASHKPLHRNRMVHYFLLQALVYAAVAAQWALPGLIFFAGQSLVAVLLLETINYVEHYGLLRKKIAADRYEPVSPQHSWDSSHWLTNRFLFNLGYHAQHHREPNRHFEALRHLEEAPRMPLGYSAMMIIALVPPLWHRIMDPRLPRIDAVV